jgi:hypothetical protein
MGPGSMMRRVVLARRAAGPGRIAVSHHLKNGIP